MSEEIVPYEAMAMVARPEVVQFAEVVVKSGLAPKSFDTKEKVLMALAFGRELGISPMQSLQGLNVINGKIGIGGDLAKAICQSQPDCEDITDDLADFQPTNDDAAVTVTVKLRGKEPTVRKFSIADAKKPGLWTKTGPWTQYPARMLYYRALGFALRDADARTLKGLKTIEELLDYPDATPQPRPIIYERPRQTEPHPADAVAQPVADAGPKRRRRKEVDETPAPVADEAPVGADTPASEPPDDVPLSPESAEFIGPIKPPDTDPAVRNLCADIRERLRVASYNEARLMRTLSSDAIKLKAKAGFIKVDWKLEDIDLDTLQKLVKHWATLLDLIRKETGA